MALFTKLPSWASILITVIAAVIVVGLVTWGTYTLVKPGPSKLPEGEEGVVPEEINFSETGNLMINNPGFEPNQWYLSYEKPGAPGLSVALSFDKKSICLEGGVKEVCQVSKLSSGDRVTIKGIKSDDNVLVRELVKLSEEVKDWKTYRNEEYGFEVKYPATWQNPTERDFATYPESGIKDAFAVEFYKNTVNGKGVSGEGFFMIISKRDDLGYRDLSSGVGLPLNPTFSDFKKCSTPVSEVVIGVENYPAKKVYISPTDKCFQPGYWYVFQNGEYSYDIRSRSDGFTCVGCDGEPTTKEKFPEFYQIISTFKFTK